MKRTTFSFLTAFVVLVWAATSALADPAETEIEAPGPKGPLKGLMVSPGKPDAPVVLIIPGSGPVDRDGNSLHGLNTDTYKLLAAGLAERGVASVRIDKRGMRSSAAAIPNANDVTIADYASECTAGPPRSSNRRVASAFGCWGTARAGWSRWRRPRTTRPISAAFCSSPRPAAHSPSSSRTRSLEPGERADPGRSLHEIDELAAGRPGRRVESAARRSPRSSQRRCRAF